MSEFKNNTTDKPFNHKKVAFLIFGVMLLVFPIFLFSVGFAVDFCDEGWGSWDGRGIFSFFFKQTLFTVYILIGLGYLLAGIFNSRRFLRWSTAVAVPLLLVFAILQTC